MSRATGTTRGQRRTQASLYDLLKGYADNRMRQIRPAKKPIPKRIVIRDRKLVLYYSSVLIEVLQEALDYDPHQRKNSKPPPLYIDDDTYRAEVVELIAELRCLNDLLASRKAKAGDKSGSVLRLRKRADTFLHHYAATLGKSAAYLTAAAFAAVFLAAGLSTYVPLRWK